MELSHFFELEAPTLVDFELTYDCNLNCEFCYNTEGEKGAKYTKSEEDDKRKLDKRKEVIDEIVNIGVSHLAFTGGEPFLDSQLLDLIEYAKSRDIYISINTNGTLITENLAKILKRLKILGVLITLQGGSALEHDIQTRVKGSWEKTLLGLKYLKNEGVNITINMTVTKNNFKLVKNVARIANKFNADFSISRFITTSKKSKNLELSLPDLNELKHIIEDMDNIKSLTPIPSCTELGREIVSGICTAGLCRCCITPDLHVKPCIFSGEVIGNLEDKSLKELWLSDKMKKWRCKDFYHSECLSCPSFSECGGGCRVAAQYSKNKRDPLMTSKREGNIFSEPIAYESVNLEHRYEPKIGVKFRQEVFGGILTSEIGKVFILNSPASIIIWKQLENKAEIRDIINIIKNKYKINEEVIEKDVKSFIFVLQHKGLIHEFKE